MLSGFSHPSFWFQSEHREVGADSTVTYKYRFVDLDKMIRMAVQSFLDAEVHWVGYYMANDQPTIEIVTRQGESLDEISVSLKTSEDRSVDPVNRMGTE